MSAIERLGITAAAIRKLEKKYSPAQEQTKETFGFKWAQREATESPAVQAAAKQWLFERYCDNRPERLAEWLSGGRKIILDAGCGSGYSAIPFFGEHLKAHDYLGVDISSAVEIARQRFKDAGLPGDFLRCSITDLPVKDAALDMVFSEGVLHHTDSTEGSLKYLAKKLKKGGRFLFYVYAQKGPIREFTDDYVRQRIASMTDEEAWEALKPLTEFGIALGKLKATVNVPEDIPLLSIRKGPVDLQRFLYWNICKTFYREDYTFDEMHAVNFDWFRPAHCRRHTPEEVKTYCQAAALDIKHMNVQEAGITVVARKH
jgi:arsenite methyltransferase